MTYLDKAVAVSLGALVALGLLSFCAARAQEPITVTINRPCAPVEVLAEVTGIKDPRIQPILVDTFGFGWVVLHDTTGEQPDVLGFIADHDGEKLFCLMARVPGKNT